MSAYGFSSNYLVHVCDGAQTVLGTFQPSVTGYLQHLRMQMYRHGTAGGSESFVLQLFQGYSEGLTTPVMESDAVTFAALAANQGATWTAEQGWAGRIRFDITGYINKNTTYTLVAKATNYTRNGDTYYVGFRCHYDQGRDNTSFLAPDVEIFFK